MDPPETFIVTLEDASPELVVEFPPVFPELSFPPVSELAEILKLMLELLLWLIVQLVELLISTLLFDPAPLPEIITVVPPPDGEPEGEGLADGELEGVALGEGEADGLSEGAGLPEGLEVGLADADGEGLGKVAAAAKEFPKLPALLEKSPNTDSFKANSTKQIKNELKKYVLLIPYVIFAKLSSRFVFQFPF